MKTFGIRAIAGLSLLLMLGNAQAHWLPALYHALFKGGEKQLVKEGAEVGAVQAEKGLLGHSPVVEQQLARLAARCAAYAAEHASAGAEQSKMCQHQQQEFLKCTAIKTRHGATEADATEFCLVEKNARQTVKPAETPWWQTVLVVLMFIGLLALPTLIRAGFKRWRNRRAPDKT